jgi:hypothetical protein
MSYQRSGVVTDQHGVKSGRPAQSDTTQPACVPPHNGVLPPHAVHSGPQVVASLQATQKSPLQRVPRLHDPRGMGVGSHTQPIPAPAHNDISLVQASQSGPQWAASEHD